MALGRFVFVVYAHEHGDEICCEQKDIDSLVVFGAPWRGPLRTNLGPSSGPAPGPALGTQKVSKLCNCSQKQAPGHLRRFPAVPDSGTPWGLFKIPH